MSFNGYFSVHGVTTTIMTMLIMMIMVMMREPCSPPEAMPIMVCVMIMMREVRTCTHNTVQSGHMRPPQSWGRTTWKILGCMKCQAGSIILAP